MPEYAPGVPMWVDVSSPNMEKTCTFYSGLFGWNPETVPDPAAGGYTIFTLDGKQVAAAGPTMDPNQHPAWTVYVCTADTDATAAAAVEAGGQVVVPPMDVLGQTKIAVLQDPTGAYIALNQPLAHGGAEVVNQPNSFCWNELYTRDMAAARAFYGKVFGWTVEESTFSEGTYTLFQVDGRAIAGGLDMTSFLPESVPPHWLTYFTVTDAAATAAKVKELGGTVIDGPKATQMGPIAILQDPVGAAFAVIEVTAES